MLQPAVSREALRCRALIKSLLQDPRVANGRIANRIAEAIGEVPTPELPGIYKTLTDTQSTLTRHCWGTLRQLASLIREEQSDSESWESLSASAKVSASKLDYLLGICRGYESRAQLTPERESRVNALAGFHMAAYYLKDPVLANKARSAIKADMPNLPWSKRFLGDLTKRRFQIERKIKEMAPTARLEDQVKDSVKAFTRTFPLVASKITKVPREPNGDLAIESVYDPEKVCLHVKFTGSRAMLPLGQTAGYRELLSHALSVNMMGFARLGMASKLGLTEDAEIKDQMVRDFPSDCLLALLATTNGLGQAAVPIYNLSTDFANELVDGITGEENSSKKLTRRPLNLLTPGPISIQEITGGADFEDISFFGSRSHDLELAKDVIAEFQEPNSERLERIKIHETLYTMALDLERTQDKCALLQRMIDTVEGPAPGRHYFKMTHAQLSGYIDGSRKCTLPERVLVIRLLRVLDKGIAETQRALEVSSTLEPGASNYPTAMLPTCISVSGKGIFMATSAKQQLASATELVSMLKQAEQVMESLPGKILTQRLRKLIPNSRKAISHRKKFDDADCNAMIRKVDHHLQNLMKLLAPVDRVFTRVKKRKA